MGPENKLKLSPRASYGAIVRHVARLRAEVSAYDCETDVLKTAAFRAYGPVARNAVDADRRAGFDALRNALRDAEQAYANWKPLVRKPKREDRSFSEMMRGAMKRPYAPKVSA